MKALIYCRVSRQDQDYQRQISDLKAAATSKGWEIAEVVTEKVSGVKTKRAGIAKVLELAETGKFQKLLVTEISRIGRSTLQVLKIIERLTELKISVYLGNYGVETLQPDGKRNPMIAMLISILSEFAAMERDNLIDRTNSGLEFAKKNGTVLGRPFGTTKTNEQLISENPKVVKLLNAKRSVRETAKLTDRSVNTVLKVKRALSNIR